MAIALIATLTSLFALAWPGPKGHVAASPPQGTGTGTGEQLIPDLTLHAADGSDLHLRNLLPAVLLLADGCSCADLELATAKAAPPGVTVVEIARTAPVLPTDVSGGLLMRSAADPDGLLRSRYGSAPTATGTIAVLVRNTGQVIRTVPRVTVVADFAPDLAKLT
jgi:hypothetical protein